MHKKEKKKTSASASPQWKNGKKEKKKSVFSACIRNVKEPKQLRHYVEQVMESKSYNNDSDADGYTVLEEYETLLNFFKNV